MATKESTASQEVNVRGAHCQEYDFNPLTFGFGPVEKAKLPGGAVQDFANVVETVSVGSASILRLIEWDECRLDDHRENPEAAPLPILNEFHKNALLRLVAVNLDLIAGKACSVRQWAYEHHTQEGRSDMVADALRRANRRD